ncbi:hypothetical protein HRM2_33840 [Desulforapulum autotrophicum HRM2]|uniref:Uncharacterized protein n=1 Tax=Desulforapulum autotrophicum (strain ATCC 43914 / DSM 3382 / VKM B-1955 / HRM2) TaxID=177437 RepID=C0QME2_DESAH|nr:hypothetical protein [Desulforapulum autotrophicum]ACN16459.1 hypothetical protein HRM2_33840 [Desulforapulum autotrophicum HRM2]
MATTKPKRPESDAPPQALSLSDLFGALSRAFIAATVNHYATMTYWKQACKDNPVLSDDHPHGMKIVSAQVPLSVAVAQKTANPPRVEQRTKTIIAEPIISDDPKSKRQEATRVIYAVLAREGKLSFSNAQRLTDLDKTIKMNLPDTKKQIDKQFLSDLQRDFLTQPAGNLETSLLYRAAYAMCISCVFASLSRERRKVL